MCVSLSISACVCLSVGVGRSVVPVYTHSPFSVISARSLGLGYRSCLAHANSLGVGEGTFVDVLADHGYEITLWGKVPWSTYKRDCRTPKLLQFGQTPATLFWQVVKLLVTPWSPDEDKFQVKLASSLLWPKPETSNPEAEFENV